MSRREAPLKGTSFLSTSSAWLAPSHCAWKQGKSVEEIDLEAYYLRGVGVRLVERRIARKKAPTSNMGHGKLHKHVASYKELRERGDYW